MTKFDIGASKFQYSKPENLEGLIKNLWQSVDTSLILCLPDLPEEEVRLITGSISTKKVVGDRLKIRFDSTESIKPLEVNGMSLTGGKFELSYQYKGNEVEAVYIYIYVSGQNNSTLFESISTVVDVPWAVQKVIPTPPSPDAIKLVATHKLGNRELYASVDRGLYSCQLGISLRHDGTVEQFSILMEKNHGKV